MKFPVSRFIIFLPAKWRLQIKNCFRSLFVNKLHYYVMEIDMSTELDHSTFANYIYSSVPFHNYQSSQIN